MLKSQQKILGIPEYTILGEISNEYSNPFRDAIERLKKLTDCQFKETEYLHFTFLKLIAKSGKPFLSDYVEYVIGPIANYFKDEKLGPLIIRFDMIRLGAWEYTIEEQKKYRSQISCERSCRNFISDGTVIAKGVVHGDTHGTAFVDARRDLATYLCDQLPDLFDDHIVQNRCTIWATLEYYNKGKDFMIDKELHDVLEYIKPFDASVTIDTLKIFEFRLKSLKYGRQVSCIEL